MCDSKHFHDEKVENINFNVDSRKLLQCYTNKKNEKWKASNTTTTDAIHHMKHNFFFAFDAEVFVDEIYRTFYVVLLIFDDEITCLWENKIKNGKKWQLVKENMKDIRKLKCNGHIFRRKNFIRNFEFVFLFFFSHSPMALKSTKWFEELRLNIVYDM